MDFKNPAEATKLLREIAHYLRDKGHANETAFIKKMADSIDITEKTWSNLTKKKLRGIIEVRLAYEIPVGEDPEVFLSNVELPPEYVEDSFEFIKTEVIPNA